MELVTTISSIVLVASLGYLIWTIQKLSSSIDVLKDEINKIRMADAGTAAMCKNVHKNIDDKLQNHEGRIQKLEDPRPKKKQKRG